MKSLVHVAPITAAQKDEIQHVIDALLKATPPRGKRRLADMFLNLVDRDSWPEYYEVITRPRCLNGIKDNLANNKYKTALEIYEDVSLVFLNALFYNEDGSQIAKDASTLRTLLDTHWKQSTSLPPPPDSPPVSTPQKIHRTRSTVQHSAQSAAGTSTPARPAQPPPPQSPERPSTPEMDVDVGGTPEPEGMTHETVRDGESDAIVRQLEKGLPRWEGFADMGWSHDISTESQVEIVEAISGFKDSSGHRIAETLEAMPEETSIPDLSFDFPLSLSTIEAKSREKGYMSSQAFDKEMSQLFLKARRYHESNAEQYGHALHLQRLYQALTSPNPPSQPPYTSQTYFASLRAGPGFAKPLHSADAEGVPGVTTFRVSTKDRTFVDVVQYKGWGVRLADWLHLSNPDDPSRPIIAQVFKCWVSDEPSRKGQPGVTVCWYYRPEQTFHPAQRQFWEKEIFKTSHFADHPLEDIIEKIACQFTARHIRGRPRPPFWYPSWPLYVCDSRYNDRERIFVKIKNWNSCVPEEVRKSTEFMPIYPFERTVFPRRFASPFVSGNGKLTGVPGGIGDVVERAEGEKIEGGGTGRKRPKRSATGQNAATPSRSEQTDRTGPSRGLYVGGASGQAGGSSTTSASGYPYLPGSSQVQYAHASVFQHRGGSDRSLVTALGGAANLGGSASLERLPSETAKHFDRDPETNEVLWFAAPPVDMAHPPGPRYSLAYLHYLAKKRKTAKETAVPMDTDDDANSSEDARRRKPTRSMTEIVNELLTEYGFD